MTPPKKTTMPHQLSHDETCSRMAEAVMSATLSRLVPTISVTAEPTSVK